LWSQNITNAETKHTNLCVLRQCITLDQDYGAKFEHFARKLNTGADGLSYLEMTNKVPNDVLSEIYAINELDRNINRDFPLAMRHSLKQNKARLRNYRNLENQRMRTVSEQ
jgi:hypothetical protein